MTINWNKVTWYSKIAAIVLFVGTFWLGFWLGTMKVEKVYIEVPHIILRSEKQTEPTPLGDEEAPNKHFFANGATVAVDNNFHVTIKTKDYLEGPALSYTRNTQTVASSFIVGTSTLDYYHSSDGLFVKEGPYEWYETSGAQCGACARATINVYYFNLTKGTSTLAFTYTNLYDQNDSDFELSLDWQKLTDYEFGPQENASTDEMYDVATYRWTATSYCFDKATFLYEQCGIKHNVQPPHPRNFRSSRQVN